MLLQIFSVLILTLTAASCRMAGESEVESSCRYARYFDIIEIGDTCTKAIVVISPYSGTRDTLLLDKPLGNLICMSSSQVAGLSEIGADSVISAVSGLRYITNPALHQRNVPDVGYEASLDYETILNLKPDVVLAYTVSGAEPPYLSRLRSLGICVLVLHDHLENHPLARAEYLRLYGALTGHVDYADSLYASICERYDLLTAQYGANGRKVKVLMNVPYGDAWYIPGGDSYMARLVSDAGGEVLGAKSGTSHSRVITLEEAYRLSQSADMWLNPGPCRTIADLRSFHHTFNMFGPVAQGLPIYNNTLRTTPEGGNDFWESGSVRPDLLLEDLLNIFSASDRLLKYHFEVK